MDPASADAMSPPPAPRRAWPVRLFDALVRRATLAVAAATGLSFLARLHWSLDNLTAFVPQYAAAAAGCLIALLLLRRWKWSIAAAVVFFVNAARLFPTHGAAAGGGDERPLRLVSANVNFGTRDFERFAAFVRDAKPDVLVVVEFTSACAERLESLRREMPHAVLLPRDDPFGVALYSRIPFDETDMDKAAMTGFPSIVARITHDGRRVTVIGTHPPPPVGDMAAADRNRQFAELARRASDEPGEVVLAGDLNVAPWSPHFRDLLRDGRLADSRLGFAPQGTWPAFLSPVMTPIDHILVSDGVVVLSRQVGPEVGSDHRPVVADLGLER